MTSSYADSSAIPTYRVSGESRVDRRLVRATVATRVLPVIDAAGWHMTEIQIRQPLPLLMMRRPVFGLRSHVLPKAGTLGASGSSAASSDAQDSRETPCRLFPQHVDPAR